MRKGGREEGWAGQGRGVQKSDGEERQERIQKVGKEGWKEKVGDAEGDRKGDKNAAFLSRGAASLLGLPDLTQSHISEDGVHQ